MNNWEDFWLNEGFTVFFERHVSAMLYDVDFAKVEALLGNTSLYNAMETIGWDNTYASIHPVLQGDNPDNSFSEVPYEKGFQLLQWIEDSVLDTIYMEDFMTYYIVNNKLTSINAFTMRETFANFVETFFNPNSSMVNSILDKVNWEEWIYVVGLDPTGTLNFTTDGST